MAGLADMFVSTPEDRDETKAPPSSRFDSAIAMSVPQKEAPDKDCDFVSTKA